LEDEKTALVHRHARISRLIGDSVHAIPLLGARGANFAISDAVELAGGIEEHGTEQEAVQRFY
jgi:2-polyprenyl-6-methoxyphenol hydroxylase-like FAD-dependent oxidoreductase